jgi:hypothetical protein
MRLKFSQILTANLVLIGVLLVFAYEIKGTSGIFDTAAILCGAYTTLFNVLYQRNMKFYLLINRIKFKLSPTSTMWLASFRFGLDPGQNGPPSTLLTRIAERLRAGGHGRVEVRGQFSNSLEILIDELIGLTISLDQDSVFVALDRKLSVSSDQYQRYQHKLRRIADDISLAINPTDLRCELQVSFQPGAPNPYYGFLVNRVPSDLLQDFRVSFKLNRDSNCRIMANLDHVGVDASNLGDLFDALSEVLSLRALPGGVA